MMPMITPADAVAALGIDQMGSADRCALDCAIIIDLVATEFGVAPHHLTSRRTEVGLRLPRYVALMLAVELTGHSMPKIGIAFDRTKDAVKRGAAQGRQLARGDIDVAARVEVLRLKLQGSAAS